MNKIPLHILRLGLGITFLWISLMIFQNPEAWSGYIKPWVANLLLLPINQVMIGNAFLDMIIGLLLLCNFFTWQAATLGTIHLVGVLVVSGITDITVRDIGLLAASLALMISFLPDNIYKKIYSDKI